jgi:hypothetical protein
MPSQYPHRDPGAGRRVVGQRRPGVVGRSANGQPRTYRLAPTHVQDTAYRNLALAILGLDVATLADELRSARASAAARITSISITGSAA